MLPKSGEEAKVSGESLKDEGRITVNNYQAAQSGLPGSRHYLEANYVGVP
jgi:hypothetical protein